MSSRRSSSTQRAPPVDSGRRDSYEVVESKGATQETPTQLKQSKLSQTLAKRGTPAKKKTGEHKGRNKGHKSVFDSVVDYKWSLRDAADSAMLLANAASRLFNTEEKQVNVQDSFTAVVAGTVSTLTACTQGSDFNNRDGDSIKLLSFGISYHCLAPAADTRGHIVRLVVVRDLEGQGSAPTWADVFDSAYSTPPYGVVVALNFNAQRRFQVLMDHRLEFDLDRKVRVGAYSSRDMNHIFYRGTGATAADNGEGHLYLFTISDESASGNSPVVSFRSRFTFVDN